MEKKGHVVSTGIVSESTEDSSSSSSSANPFNHPDGLEDRDDIQVRVTIVQEPKILEKHFFPYFSNGILG